MIRVLFGRFRHGIIGSSIVVFVAGPVLLTNRGLNIDFTNDLWFGHVQASTIGSGIFPSYFLNTFGTVASGVFDPHFAFYGGTLYALLGELARVLGGDVVVAFDVLAVGFIAFAYFGLYWISRQFSISPGYSHAVPIAYVTSAYYITILYGRGDVAEFAAVSVLPMVLAAGLALLREPYWSPKTTVLFATALVIFTGSHDISLVWGTSLVAVLLVLLLVVVRPSVAWRRVIRVAVVAVPAVMLNGWFLVPDLLYGHDTMIAAKSTGVIALFFDSFPLLLNPLRAVPAASGTPALFVQIPVWMLLWALAVGGAAVASSRSRSLRRPFLVLVVMFGFVLGLITIPGVWRSIPRPWLYIQFPYRLNTYLALIVSALVGVAVLVAQRMPTAAPDTGRLLRLVVRASLGAVCAISLALCAWQLWIPRTLAYPAISDGLHVTGYANRYDAMTSIDTVPTSWDSPLDYANTSGPIISVSPGCELTIDPKTIDNHGDSVTTVVQAPLGSGPLGTNIVAGPYLVSIGGDVVRVGTSPDGFAVVQRREPGTESGNAMIKGWALDDQKLEPAKEVLAVRGDRVIAVTRPDIYRADVAKYFASKTTAYSGFLLKVPAHMIQHHLQIYTLNLDGTVSRLNGLSTNCVSPIELGRTLQFLRGENGMLYRVQASSRSNGYVEEVELPVLITVNTARSLGVVAGRVSSTVGAVLIVGLALYLASAARRRRTLRRSDRLRP
ncbi:MAG: hypothetical protein ABSA31_07120 [Acidimicrobiales bacterium]|jgi:hypothetical protein